MRRFVLVAALSLAAPALALEAGGVEWERYVAREWKIAFYVPEGMRLREREGDGWAALEGRDGDVVLVVQAVRDLRSFEELERRALRDLRIPEERWRREEAGASDRLEYRTYAARFARDGAPHRAVAIVARHMEADLSYVAYVLAPAETWDRRARAFEFWYRNVKGLPAR